MRPIHKEVPQNGIKESCISGECEGRCRELYYATCPAHQKFYMDTSEIPPKRVYIWDEKNILKGW